MRVSVECFLTFMINFLFLKILTKKAKKKKKKKKQNKTKHHFFAKIPVFWTKKCQNFY